MPRTSSPFPCFFLPPTGTPGIDSYTKLMLHLDGNVTDSSLSPKTVTNNGCTFSSGISKFSESTLVAGASTYLSVPDSDDWAFGTNPFTIDFWFYLPTVEESFFYGQGNVGAHPSIFLEYSTSAGGPGVPGFLFIYYNAGYQIYFDSRGQAPLTANTWYHFALVRVDNSNSSAGWRMFLNGVSLPLTRMNAPTWSASIGNISAPIALGRWTFDVNRYLNGYMDEYRISTGIARWTSNFTPPTSAYV